MDENETGIFEKIDSNDSTRVINIASYSFAAINTAKKVKEC